MFDLSFLDDLDTLDVSDNPSELVADGKTWDLENYVDVKKLVDRLERARGDLNAGKLKVYDGKPTAWGGGGRAELLRDQLVAELAEEYHHGKNSLSFEDMKQIAAQKASDIAKVRRNQGRF